MKRCSSNMSSSPLGALALFFFLLLLLLVCSSSSSFHCAAAARLLQPAAVPLLIAAHHESNGDKAAAAAAADGLVVLESAAVVSSGDELSVSSEVLGAEEAEAEDKEGAVACEEAGNDDECLQRRLLQNAHLDYIYTQHKGKP